MKRIDIGRLSDRYTVRRLGAEDAEAVFSLCRENTLYYRYSEQDAALDSVRKDLTVTPPGIPASQKYYVGFYDGGSLTAVMDLIDGYPDDRTAFIGFFMMRHDLQGAGTGSAIIARVLAYLKEAGYTVCRLGIDRDNPQSNHFWEKNGFRVIREIPREKGAVLLAERKL